MVSLSDFIKRARYIDSLAVWEIASSSASVDDVVTVSCLLARHATGPPNSFIM